MNKKTFGPETYLFPMPTVLVGVKSDEKVNYMTVAYCGIVGYRPALIAFSPGKASYTNSAIKRAGSFSINIPTIEMAAVTDYCGLESGANTDKSRLFTTFYGKQDCAPMIEECPVNLECRLLQTLCFGDIDEVFIGEIVEVYAGEEFLTNGLPDIQKINPILFSIADNTYWSVGSYLAKAFDAGKNVNNKGFKSGNKT